MLLRIRIIALAAATVPVVAAAVAVPAWLLLREAQGHIDVLTMARQEAVVSREVLRAVQPLGDTVRRIAGDATLAEALARQDIAVAQSRLGEPAARVEVIARGGRILLAAPPAPGAEGMIDAAPILREYAPGHGGSGIEPTADGDGLRLVSFVRGQGPYIVAAETPFGPMLDVIGEALGGQALVADLAGRPLGGDAAQAWRSIGRAGARAASVPIAFDEQGRRMQIVPTLLVGGGGVPVARLFVMSDVSDAARRHDLVLLVAGLVLVGVILSAGILLFRMLRSALEPLDDLAGVLHAIAAGDRLASAPVDGRQDEIGQIARALEVVRSSGIALDRLQTRDRLARRRHLALIGGEAARLAEVLEPSEREAVGAVLRRLEREPAGGTEGMAVAFQTMVENVRNRHARLNALLEERTRDLELVREALEQRVLLDRVVQELEVARRLQLDTLPSVFPTSAAYDMHAAMWPAKEVGGDFYDVLVLADGSVAFMVGDASGKGVAAAIFVAMTRSLLRAAIARGASPAEALEQANAALAADNPTMMFATAFVAVLDPATGLLRYANAGHNPPRIVGPAVSQEALGGADGIALGVVEDFIFEDRMRQLIAGETLVLFTDGVTEADRADGTLFGDDRLSDALLADSSAGPVALVGQIAAAVNAFAEGRQQADDITLLCLAYAGAAAQV